MVVRRRAIAAVLVLVALAVAACGGDDGDSDGRPSGLPTEVGDEPATAYRVVYRLTSPGGSGREVLEVRRPFEAHLRQEGADGEVTAERWSALGAVVTRSADGSFVELSVAAAPALGDQRLDRMVDELEAAEQLTGRRTATVAGRPCTFVDQRSEVATLPAGADPSVDEAKQITAVVERCVDAEGIVLEERWSSPGGERLLTKRATELATGDDLDLDLELPEAESLPAASGNGSFEPVDPDAPGPLPQQFDLEPGEGFSFVGRFAVQPPRLGAPAGDAGLRVTTDVWRRGPDVLLLDQGVGTGGATPFDEALVWRPLDLPGLGAAQLAGNLTSAEVRIRRPDGGFVRLAGTVPVADLVALAGEITSTG
ncbi:MAG: hypothetical protein M3Z03_04780 [Actinomycetota bacterium]|nr:hypothetical protein [Actinomycetota bacterium]